VIFASQLHRLDTNLLGNTALPPSLLAFADAEGQLRFMSTPLLRVGAFSPWLSAYEHMRSGGGFSDVRSSPPMAERVCEGK
jgi:hypothetical protein